MQNGHLARGLILPGHPPPLPEPPCYFDAAGQVRVRADLWHATAAFWQELAARTNAVLAARAQAEQERDALRAELESIRFERDEYRERWQRLAQERPHGS